LRLIEVLFKPYTFQELLKAIYDTFGVGGVLTLALGYIATLTYFAMEPYLMYPPNLYQHTSSLYQHIWLPRKSKIYGALFILKVLGVFVVLLLVLFILFILDINSNPQYLHIQPAVGAVLVTLFMVLALVPFMFINVSSKVWSYECCLAVKNFVSRFLIPLPDFIRYLISLVLRNSALHQATCRDVIKTHLRADGLLWFVILSLGALLAWFDFCLPLVLWIFIVIIVAPLGVMVAAYYALLFHVAMTPYAIVKLVDGREYEGFLAVRGDGYLVIMTRSEGVAVFDGQVKEIIPKPPKEPVEEQVDRGIQQHFGQQQILSKNCQDLVQRCEKVREEVYRHLAAFEGIGSNVAFRMLAVISWAVGASAIIVGTLATIMSLASVRPDLYYFIVATIVIIWTVLLVSPIVFVVRYRGVLRDLMRLIGEGFKLRGRALEEYIKHLEVCCRELGENQCTADHNTLCLDLEWLGEFVRAVKLKRPQRVW